jgi:hypothetical protein
MSLGKELVVSLREKEGDRRRTYRSNGGELSKLKYILNCGLLRVEWWRANERRSARGFCLSHTVEVERPGRCTGCPPKHDFVRRVFWARRFLYICTLGTARRKKIVDSTGEKGYLFKVGVKLSDAEVRGNFTDSGSDLLTETWANKKIGRTKRFLGP